MRRVLALALLAPAPAHALEEIVVTAERRPIPIERLAGSIASLSGAELERLGAEHPAEALNRLPGVNVHRNNGVENLPAIRSPVLTGGQSAGSFLVLEDGVPVRAPAFANVNQLFETSLEFADRVEVVRGPGSALYGSNAVHGLVNVLTAPAAGAAGLRAGALSFGAYERLSGEVQIGLAPGALLAVSAVHEGGARAQSGFDQQKALFGWAGALGAWRVDARFAAQNLNQETAGFIEGPQAYEDEALVDANPTPEAYRDSRLARAQARLSRPLGRDLTLALTPFARFVETDLILSFFPSRAQEITRQKGGGLQTALYWDPGAAVSAIVGLDLDHTQGELSEVQARPTVGTFVQGLHYDYRVDATMLALFAQTSWAFAPHWRLVGGVRGEAARYDYDNRAPDGDVGRFRRAPDRTDDFSYVTPKLGLVRDFGAGASAFLNAARGARAPQASDLYSLQTRQTPGDQNPETIDSLEAGLRLPVLSRGRIEIAAFAMEKRDTAFRNAEGLTITDGRTRHRGVEVSGLAPLGPHVDLSGWWTYARHTYRFESPADGVAIGATVDTAPETLANLRLAWRPAPGVEAEIEGVHVGDYFTDAANARAYPGHTLANARLRFALTPRVEAAFAVRNLLDEAYAERADFAFGTDRYFPGEPQRFSVALRYAR